MIEETCGQEVGPRNSGWGGCPSRAGFVVTADTYRGGVSLPACGQHLARVVRELAADRSQGVIVREVKS